MSLEVQTLEESGRLDAVKETINLVCRGLVLRETQAHAIALFRDHGDLLADAVAKRLAAKLREELWPQGNEGAGLAVVMNLGAVMRNGDKEDEEIAPPAAYAAARA